VSFTGVRGIVSLAAALGLPLAVPVAHHFRIAI
jgi:NhaP-type Na+/H+ or K+/H+ antiporter